MLTFTFEGGPTIDLELDQDAHYAFRLESRDNYFQDQTEVMLRLGSEHNLRDALNKVHLIGSNPKVARSDYEAIRSCVSGIAQFEACQIDYLVRTAAFAVTSLLVDEIRISLVGKSTKRFMILIKSFDYICEFTPDQIERAQSFHELMHNCIAYAEEKFDGIGQARY